MSLTWSEVSNTDKFLISARRTQWLRPGILIAAGARPDSRRRRWLFVDVIATRVHGEWCDVLVRLSHAGAVCAIEGWVIGPTLYIYILCVCAGALWVDGVFVLTALLNRSLSRFYGVFLMRLLPSHSSSCLTRPNIQQLFVSANARQRVTHTCDLCNVRQTLYRRLGNITDVLILTGETACCADNKRGLLNFEKWSMAFSLPTIKVDFPDSSSTKKTWYPYCYVLLD